MSRGIFCERRSDVAVHSFDRTLLFLFLRSDTLIHAVILLIDLHIPHLMTRKNQETRVKSRKESFIFCVLGRLLISSRPFFSAQAAVHHRCLRTRLPHHPRNLVELS